MKRWEAQEVLDELAEELDNRHGINDSDDFPESTVFCPLCKGDRVEVLGRLGSLQWFRCGNCHAIFQSDELLELVNGEELLERGELR